MVMAVRYKLTGVDCIENQQVGDSVIVRVRFPTPCINLSLMTGILCCQITTKLDLCMMDRDEIKKALR